MLEQQDSACPKQRGKNNETKGALAQKQTAHAQNAGVGGGSGGLTGHRKNVTAMLTVLYANKN